MADHVIGTEEALKAQGTLLVELDGRSIGVYFRNDAWFAVRNRCPHHGAELCRGLVSGTVVVTDAGELEYTMDGRILRCPWHGFEFDLQTGRSLAAPDRLRVKTYDVRVEDGMVVVRV